MPILIFGCDKEIGSNWTRTGGYLKKKLDDEKKEWQEKFVGHGHLSLGEFKSFWDNFTILYFKSNPCFPDHKKTTPEEKDSEEEKKDSDKTASTSNTESKEKNDADNTDFTEATPTENE
eukprot:CAMPEP_0114584712 /NCGR_PEP_ID=MMETSP0125-20121206/8368_1 /TAXON_ID=485358 ORGANISM="Aristerostoma sp., Strain ATCC 50986" /NCGR_SAMPLE_ID=MMETSP0125 /ASSEMBLY_ACC=CAM_ASM_000245 /LENGTH=118 /DNA_ID=CAMNT_0001779289 /DNA_START=927 /DNA_END=1283 /DNA_ORIENTATION=+